METASLFSSRSRTQTLLFVSTIQKHKVDFQSDVAAFVRLDFGSVMPESKWSARTELNIWPMAQRQHFKKLRLFVVDSVRRLK